MRHLKTAREVVDVLGGHVAVCQLTGANRKAAYYWTGQAGTFPARQFVRMQYALKRRKATAPPSLWSMVPVVKNAKKKKAA
jgi:hypothetical protein